MDYTARSDEEVGPMEQLRGNIRPMANSPNLSFRVPFELIERLDTYTRSLAAETGLTVTRTNALVKLLTERLDQIDAESARGRKPKR
jgi:hypothetical protein